MTQRERKFNVTPGQVFLARELLKRKVWAAISDPRVWEVANLPFDEVAEEWESLGINAEKIQAAQILIRLRGGEEFVEPEVVALAHAKLPSPSDAS